jgi:WhiB family redox-sensing transcriptional regulator
MKPGHGSPGWGTGPRAAKGTPNRYAERPLNWVEEGPLGTHPCLVTDVGAFLLIPPQHGHCNGVHPRVIARSYPRISMNVALVEWLMTPEAPEPPDVEVLLAELVNRPAWHALANCQGADPDLFFPARGDGRPVAALAYCEDCSVRSQCLAAGLEVARTLGVWGGTTGLERRGMRRRAVA